MRLVAIAAIFASVLIAIPIATSAGGIDIGVVPSAIMVGAGVMIAVLAGLAAVVFNLYQKATPSEAFVRTGMGGSRVITDGGSIVIPVVHTMTVVPLSTLKLVVKRIGNEALITLNKVRADITAEFFVRVEPSVESIKKAATTFGDKLNNEQERQKLIEDKLVSALRNVAAGHTLEDLNADRQKFIEAIFEAVKKDLQENGLTLESVTISALDQTDVRHMRQDNVFDAQGLAVIAKTTQAAITEANSLQREGEQARKERDVTARKAILGQEQSQAEAEAEQAAAIVQARQAARRKEITVELEVDQATRVREQERDQAVEVATQTREQAVQVATVTREQTVAVATQTREQAEQVATQTREQAVALAAADRAKAEEERATAEALAEKARQSIKTVEVEAEAERRRKVEVIAAEAAAQKQLVTTQRGADGDAYKVTAKADADKAAAEAQALAITTKAEADAKAKIASATADRDAKVAQAEGDLAIAKVPVDVKNAEVDVDRRRVEVDQTRLTQVTIPDLEAKEKYGRVAIDLEIAKTALDAGARVAIETAKAAAEVGKNVHMRLFGTPEEARAMFGAVATGQKGGSLMSEFLDSAPPIVRRALGGLVDLLPHDQEVTAPVPSGPESTETAPVDQA